MTRQETLESYEVDSNGLIVSPGKFEAEAIYVPHFWGATLDGSCDMLDWPDGSRVYIVEIDDSDRAEFPELGTMPGSIIIEQSESGFVSADFASPERVARLTEQCDVEWESNDDSEDC